MIFWISMELQRTNTCDSFLGQLWVIVRTNINVRNEKHSRRRSAQLLSEEDVFSTYVNKWSCPVFTTVGTSILSSLFKLSIKMTIRISFPFSISSLAITKNFNLGFSAISQQHIPDWLVNHHPLNNDPLLSLCTSLSTS